MKRKKKQEGGGSTWLVTYSDLVTLLLAFFVMLFAMSSVEEAKYEQLVQSLRYAFVGQNGPTLDEQQSETDDNNISETEQGEKPNEGLEAEDPFDFENDFYKDAETVEELTTIVDAFLISHGLDSDVKVDIVKEGILIDVKEQVLFDMGKALIKPQSQGMLDSLGYLFKEMKNDIRIVGHTDNVPINTNQYPSNWELAAARSCAIVRYYVINGFEPGRFTCTSQGEYQPIADNTTDEGRSQNRRVNFLIEAVPSEIRDLLNKTQQDSSDNTNE